VVFSALAENMRVLCETNSNVMRATHAARARPETREGVCAPQINADETARLKQLWKKRVKCA